MKRLTVSILAVFALVRLHADPDNVSTLLEKIRDDHDVPGLAAAVMDEGVLEMRCPALMKMLSNRHAVSSSKVKSSERRKNCD